MPTDGGQNRSRFVWLLAPILIALLFLVLQLIGGQWVNSLRERSFDLYQTLAPKQVEFDQVAIVAIDEASLSTLGRWPWPRARIGKLVDAISKSGAAAVGLDLLFPERDTAAGGPQSDMAFADALSRAPSVLAMSLVDDGDRLRVESKIGFSFIGDGALPVDRGYRSGVAPIEPFALASSGLGIVRSFGDDDGRMRAIPLIFSEEAGAGVFRYWPTFGLELLRVAQAESAFTVRLFGSSDDALKVGQVLVPLGDGRLRLIDTPGSPPVVSAASLFQSGADPSLENKIVILAVDAAGLDSYHLTARGNHRLGAELHAIAVSQMLNGQFLPQLDRARTVELALFALLSAAMIASFALLKQRPFLVALVSLFLILVPAGLGLALYTGQSKLLDASQPMLGLILVGAGGGYALYRAADQRRLSLQRQFSQFLSPEVVAQLAQTDANAALVVEDREITVMLVDVRSYTALSEQYGGKAMVDVINHFYGIASEEIFKRGGTIDKYMGDAVLAFWNAPLDQADHAQRGFDCAQAIVERVARDNSLLVQRDLPPIKIVTVLETGICSVGNMGTTERIDYTAIGPTVNLVSRLEKYAKDDGHLLVTGPNCAAAIDTPMLKVANIDVRGFEEKVAVFVP